MSEKIHRRPRQLPMCHWLIILVVLISFCSRVALAQSDFIFEGGSWMSDGGARDTAVTNVCASGFEIPTATPSPTSTLSPFPTLTDSGSSGSTTPTVTPAPSITDPGDGCVVVVNPTPTATPSNTPTTAPTSSPRSRVYLGDFGDSYNIDQPDNVDDLLRIRRLPGARSMVTIVSTSSKAVLTQVELPAIVSRVAPVIAQFEGLNTLGAAWFDRPSQQNIFARYSPTSGKALEAISAPAKVGRVRQSIPIPGCRSANSSLTAVTSVKSRSISYSYSAGGSPLRLRTGRGATLWCSASREGNSSVLFAGTFDKRRNRARVSAWDTRTGWRLYSAVVPKIKFQDALFTALPARSEELHDAPQPIVLGRSKGVAVVAVYHAPSRKWIVTRPKVFKNRGRMIGVSAGLLSDRESGWIAVEYRGGGYLLSGLDRSTFLP